MAEMQFELVSPEKSLLSVKASSVQIPASEGEMTIMPGHSAVITTLRPGLLSVDANGDAIEYFVSGGFAEVNSETLSVLAENAIARADFTQELFDKMFNDAKDAAESATESDQKQSRAQRVADLIATAERLGLNAAA